MYAKKDHDKDDDDLDNLFGEESEGCTVYDVQKPGSSHHIYLDDRVKDLDRYNDICHKLRSYSKTDTVIMYLANFGGSCHTGQRIINAMADCKAHLRVIVDSPCYSMGALMALSGDSLEMHSGTFLMFHNYSTMDGGKGKEFMDSVQRHEKWLRKQQQTVCSPFLSKQELAQLANDKDVDVFFDDKDLSARIARHFAYQKKHRKCLEI